MKFFKYSILFGFLFNFCLGQGIVTGDATWQNMQNASVLNSRFNSDEKVEGSPYISEQFKPSKIKGYDNKIFMSKFNAFSGDMEVDFGEKIIALSSDYDCEIEFTSPSKRYKTFKYKENGMSKNDFFVILNESSKISLLKKEIIDFIEAKAAKSSYEKDKPAKFLRKSDEFYVYLNDEVIFLPKNKKKLIQFFSQYSKKDVKSFIKKEKLNAKEEKDIKTIVEFLNKE